MDGPKSLKVDCPLFVVLDRLLSIVWTVHFRLDPSKLTRILGEPSPLSSLTAPLEPSDSYRAR